MTTATSLIEHPHFVGARDDLLRAADRSPPGGLIFVIGPSGAGKSELRYLAMRALAGDPRNWKRGQLPAIAVRATLTERNRFNPKDLAMRMAMALRNPDFSWLTPRGEIADPDVVHMVMDAREISSEWSAIRQYRTEHDLRLEFEMHGKARGVRWLFLEEAASLASVTKGQSVFNYMLSYMQLAKECQLTLILMGTPRAAALWQCHPDVSRRALFVWVQRYRENRPDDHLRFARLVKTIQKRYPFASPTLALDHLQLVIVNSAGSYGEVEQLFRRADMARARRGTDHIEARDLEEAAYPKLQLERMWAEAKAFDDLCAKNPSPSELAYSTLTWGSSQDAGEK
ncbi:AAA family ATPase [Lysobacter soli]|uniref:AAA family ATPase n=1 Tax=Lysobacter soli TaxID=453783 RepID=UPI0012ECE2A0|nr:AAA family ATPase [Lysobacter soli]QGW66681.1 AAA family ATPase [Lysobacter soli]